MNFDEDLNPIFFGHRNTWRFRLQIGNPTRIQGERGLQAPESTPSHRSKRALRPWVRWWFACASSIFSLTEAALTTLSRLGARL